MTARVPLMPSPWPTAFIPVSVKASVSTILMPATTSPVPSVVAEKLLFADFSPIDSVQHKSVGTPRFTLPSLVLPCTPLISKLVASSTSTFKYPFSLVENEKRRGVISRSDNVSCLSSTSLMQFVHNSSPTGIFTELVSTTLSHSIEQHIGM